MIEGGDGQGGDRAGGDLERGAPPLRRLVDEPGADPASPAAWAVGLLRRATPYRPPSGRKQRVRMRLGQKGNGEGQGDARRRRALMLRPAIAAAILIGCGAAASAALGHWPALVAEAYHRLVAPPLAATPADDGALARRSPSGPARRALSPEPPRSAGVSGAAAGEAPSPPPATTPPPASPTSAPMHPAGRELAATPRVRRSAGPPPAPSAAPAPEETSLVLEAMRALRLEENPGRARGLLARYLARYPSGALAEEAQAMTIEAAVAHHDADAAPLARRYLRRYPAGHFLALARQTLARPLPAVAGAPAGP